MPRKKTKKASTTKKKAPKKTKKVLPNKAIVLTVTDRPEYLEKTLESLKNQMASLDTYKLYINIEPVNTDKGKKARAMCEAIDWIKTDIVVNKSVLGVVNNTYAVAERAMKEMDSMLYLEDDLVLSPDALNLYEWYLEQDHTNIAQLCLFNKWGSLAPATLHKSRAMMGWGFVMTKGQWEKYAKPAWKNPGHMWDKNVANSVRSHEGVYNLFPNLSRVHNIGENGVHVQPRGYKELVGDHKYNQASKKFVYSITNEIKPS